MKMEQKDASWLADQIRESFPKAEVKLERPGSRGKVWWIEVELRDQYLVVEWSKDRGFGISTPTGDEPYGTQSSEVLAEPDEALARALELLRTGDSAVSHAAMALRSLRKSCDVSQELLAKAMKVTQASISQTEQRGDVLLSTLANYVQALGGKLEVYAKFPDKTIPLELEFAARKSR